MENFDTISELQYDKLKNLFKLRLEELEIINNVINGEYATKRKNKFK